MQKNNKAFTLIELLVVVLIIGILAAVALPQYQKAVVKSRTAQLYTAINSLGTAVHSYALANGEWPVSFDELDIDFPIPSQAGTACALSVANANTLKQGKYFALVIGSSSAFRDAFALFTEGPYTCAGFGYIKNDTFDGDELFCVEPTTHENYAKGDFCTKVMGKTFLREYRGYDYFR